MGARISSMLEKYEALPESSRKGLFRPQLLKGEDEKALVKLLSLFPEAVANAGAELSPSFITAFLYDLAKTYSRYS